MLMWSFNRDGEADESLRQSFLNAMAIDEAGQREQRHDLTHGAQPQRGVSTLRDAFPNAHGRPDGVRDVEEEGS